MTISSSLSGMAAGYWAGTTTNYPAPPLKSNLAVGMVYYRLMDVSTNPFAVMSLIVAPAILTNACSVLVMSTSNRLARAVDRARELAKQLEGADVSSARDASQLLDDLAANETRALLLLRALQGFYSSLSGFAAAALISLIGA